MIVCYLLYASYFLLYHDDMNVKHKTRRFKTLKWMELKRSESFQFLLYLVNFCTDGISADNRQIVHVSPGNQSSITCGYGWFQQNHDVHSLTNVI